MVEWRYSNASSSQMANYKRKNIRGHVRRKTVNGYWLPKWARERKSPKR